MTIDGINYEVISETALAGFANRVEIKLRRLNGRRFYHAVRYEDGSLSGVV